VQIVQDMRKISINTALLFMLCGFLFIQSCGNKYEDQASLELKDSELLIESLENLTDIIVHDIFSPPVASRVYVYPCVAAYEILALGDSSFNSLTGQLNGLDSIPVPDQRISYSLAAIHAFNEVGQVLIFSEDKMEAFRSDLEKHLDTLDIPGKVKENSRSYAKMVSRHILQWADKDNYKESRSMPKHPIMSGESHWKPTPPAYMEGIEPHWRAIRPMVIQSADQFKPAPPPEFSMEKGSDFYKVTEEVYTAVNNATEEHRLIASFWDCNPYVMNQTGHVMIATKKITPGGHWMGIASIAARSSKSGMMKTAEIITLTAVALFDGFISCWDEKYRSNLIRPETVINQYMDADWQPILQTPPFPEHTSGHSVISNAAAVALTAVLGDGFHFVDDVEVKYGLPLREFSSFEEASSEAAISRLYGGIHYMPAIEDGVRQGKAVGHYIVSNIETYTL